MIEKNVYIKIRAKVRLYGLSETASEDLVEKTLAWVINESNYSLQDTTKEANILDTEMTDFEIIPEDN